ncbi:uncharacterized protein LOC124162458 isoform X2 [Ischnura elegans]|uniref:uncharacterized protein LOC124162458 isoform X2 n=1 Tax=Ischnura elegans TaxID=197161 RepID=UPI001ED8BF2F|nr:uncharacterized protein LOC124162458 isoform X2 [Ischnura elegans]
MDDDAHRLYEWLTQDMSVLPFKKNGKDKTAITVDDFKFVVQGGGEKLWKHVMKHVHPRKKVDSVRKNILLNRIRNSGNPYFFQEDDRVGKQWKSSLDLGKLRTAIEDKRQVIGMMKEKFKLVNSAHKLYEYKLQLSKSQLNDIERRILLLQLAKNTIASKIKIFQSSENYFERFKSGTDTKMDMSFNRSIVRKNDTMNSSIFSLGVSNMDSDLEAKTRCQNFISKCIELAKEMVEEQNKEVALEEPPKTHLDSFSLLRGTCLHSTPKNVKDRSFSKFSAKKSELRKYVSENMHQLSPQLVHELLLQRTSLSFANLAACKSKFLGTRSDSVSSASEVQKEFNGLNFEITNNMLASVKERKAKMKAEQSLKALMDAVEKELKEVFTVQTAMVEKAYELIKVEVEMATLQGESGCLEEFIKEKDAECANSSSHFPEGNMPNVKRLLKSLEKLKADGKICQKTVMENSVKFQSVLKDMKRSDFLGDLQSFFPVRGLINQEIMLFTDYPLEYQVKTNVCGKFVHDYQLLSNNSFLQNILCLGGSGMDDSFLKLCIKATQGHLPHCSSEEILVAAFNLKLSGSDDGDRDEPTFIQMLNKPLHKTEELSCLLKEKEESIEKEMAYSSGIVKSYNEEEKHILDEAEFLYTNWKKHAVDKCVPESLVFEGKSYQQWHHEVLAALYKTKNRKEGAIPEA